MPVTVTPESFNLVSYDAATIRDLATRVAADVGLPAEEDVRIDVDETTFFGRVHVLQLEPLHLKIESGALEDPKRPKQLGEAAVLDVLGLTFHRALDRRSPAFAAAPGDKDLTLQQLTAWNAYAVGRSARLGYPVSEPRRRYHFRNRHGFNDAADAVFDRLWAASDLTWADIEAACTETSAHREAATA